MDNTELELDQELKLKKAMNSLKADIEATTSCINDTDEIIDIITNADQSVELDEEALSKILKELKKISLHLENKRSQDKKIISDFKLGLAKLEREVNSRPY